jgi:hypothetical protein
MTDQDHKINSMMGLVTSMAEETQYFRNKINQIQSHLPSAPVDVSTVGGTKHIELIAVSDDEDSDSDSDSDVASDEAVSDDEEEDDEEVEDDDEEEDDEEVEDDEVEDDELSIATDLVFGNEDNKDIKIINLPLDIITHNFADIDVEEINNDILLTETTEDNTFLKTNVNLNSDLEIIEENHKTDYKKLTINKLKDLVVNKGITSDVSKLKKNDLIKLLEDE